MVVYCMRTFSRLPGLTSILLVAATDAFGLATSTVEEYAPWPVPVRIVAGGAERQDSVAAGLAALEDAVDVVLVHDAARPFVTLACVDACVQAAARHGAAIVAERARDTVKLVRDQGVIAETLDRRSIWLAQTPQGFRTALLREAYERARRDGVVATDDAALVERLGHPVHVVEGGPSNRKITTPEDLRWAEVVVRAPSSWPETE